MPLSREVVCPRKRTPEAAFFVTKCELRSVERNNLNSKMLTSNKTFELYDEASVGFIESQEN